MMVPAAGIEPANPDYKTGPLPLRISWLIVVRVVGIEPTTPRFQGEYSTAELYPDNTIKWWQDWDSNPEYPFRHDGLANRSFHHSRTLPL